MKTWLVSLESYCLCQLRNHDWVGYFFGINLKRWWYYWGCLLFFNWKTKEKTKCPHCSKRERSVKSSYEDMRRSQSREIGFFSHRCVSPDFLVLFKRWSGDWSRLHKQKHTNFGSCHLKLFRMIILLLFCCFTGKKAGKTPWNVVLVHCRCEWCLVSPTQEFVGVWTSVSLSLISSPNLETKCRFSVAMIKLTTGWCFGTRDHLQTRRWSSLDMCMLKTPPWKNHIGWTSTWLEIWVALQQRMDL